MEKRLNKQQQDMFNELRGQISDTQWKYVDTRQPHAWNRGKEPVSRPIVPTHQGTTDVQFYLLWHVHSWPVGDKCVDDQCPSTSDVSPRHQT